MNRIILNETSYFGAGCRSVIAVEAARRGFKKAFFVTDKDLIKFGVAAEIIKVFDDNHIPYELYSDVKANPTIANVQNGVAAYKASGADFIVALGGGSSIDTAKGIGIVVNNPDFADVKSLEGVADTKHKAVPTFALPTTAGTAAEVTINYEIIDEDARKKMVCVDPNDIPAVAIVDPELMKNVPPQYTAYQGFDALFHNTEVMISNGVNIISETIALSAIERIAKYLPLAVKNGEDLEAREHVAYGSTIAGIAMQLTSTTAQHAMEHAMSAYHPNLPHGAGLIMISKAFSEFFIEKHACDGQFIKMARAMGIPEADKPEDFITALVKLQKDCGVDELRMSDYGFAPDESMRLAVNARETMGGLFLANPCEMTDEECADIFEKSYR